MKNLKIFGDSIIKGVTYNGQSYHLCQEHDFDTLRAQGVTVENNAKMGATIAIRRFCSALAATTAIMTGKPSRKIRTASICRTRRQSSSSTATVRPSVRRRARGPAWQ